MKETLLRNLKAVRAEDPDELNRVRLRSKWNGPRDLLEEVNEAMSQIWDEEALESVWDLNCLVYSGAVTAIGEQERQDGMTEVGEGESDVWTDEVEDPEGEREVERAMRPEQYQQEADPKPTAKQQTISELRQGIGWIECEIKRRKSGSHRPTVKQGMRLKKLQKQLGNKLDLQKLRIALEKRKNLLRVRTTQQKALTVVKARKQADRDYAEKGPSSLTRRTSSTHTI